MRLAAMLRKVLRLEQVESRQLYADRAADRTATTVAELREERKALADTLKQTGFFLGDAYTDRRGQGHGDGSTRAGAH